MQKLIKLFGIAFSSNLTQTLILKLTHFLSSSQLIIIFASSEKTTWYEYICLKGKFINLILNKLIELIIVFKLEYFINNEWLNDNIVIVRFNIIRSLHFSHIW